MKKKKLTVIAVSAAAVLVAGVCLWVGLRYMADNRLPNFGKDYVLYVYPDTDAGAVIDSIAAGADVRRKGSLVRCVRKERLAERLQPGRYEISPSMAESAETDSFRDNPQQGASGLIDRKADDGGFHCHRFSAGLQ